ncbi:eukaryotic translation initiation factor 3 subunit C [Testicularia cyperi]|uniref:Eukaryotic translation initiation factor 3 subunit C n=1 Tax=Testicularia cyperi TaxID=1882483 RepID=A0A317XPN0_9BASI|nr:eukaryotic translation initiation factor 3 subunit C [Testicularia cyperi]
MSGFFRKVGDSDSESEISSSEEELSELESGDEQPKTTTPAAGKSRFLKGSDSDSDSDSDDDDEESLDGSDSDDDDAQDGAKKPTSRFMKGAAASDDSDSEEEVKKVVKSAKDKRIDDMQNIVSHIESAQKSGDWTSINKDYDSLLRSVDRQRTLDEPIPPFFYKTLIQLDEYLTQSIAKEKDAKKKMKAPIAKAMNGMKHKLKKAIKDNDEAVARYRADPEGFEAAAAAAAAPAVEEGESAISKGKKERLAAAVAAAESDDFQTVGRGGRTETFTSEGLFKSLSAIMEARGKKSTDKTEQIRKLSDLSSVADSPYKKLRVLLALVAARFDYNSSATAYMPVEMWESARKEINELFSLLKANRAYIVKEETPDYDDEIERVPGQNGEADVIAVRGSVMSFIDRLDDEFTKSLQNIDPHTTEYVDRLCDEKKLYETIVAAQGYFESAGQADSLSRCTMRRLEHVYAKQDVIIKALESTLTEVATSFESKLFPSAKRVGEADGPALLVRSLCTHLYQASGAGAERPRTRAMLCHIYFHALHADYHVARDMFLMSHLQDAIQLADVATQILYNRVLVQIGICAFRNGLIRESQTALQEMFATGRVKELLAQGVQKQNQFSTITPEQEKLERQRQLPFHMHINLELLECIYLVSSMLLEVPNMAFAGSDPELRKRIISRPFRRMLDYTDRQVFSGPPENTRDHIMQATKALQNGDCKACIELISEIKIWKLMPGSEEVKTMLAKRIEEVGLRTYLFSYSAYYESVSLEHLAATFDVAERVVKSMVSKMIYNDELAASLDPSANIITFHRLELTKVQQLAVTLAEKANTMLEQNERLLDAKLGEGKEQRSGAGGDRDREGGQSGQRRERRGGAAGRGRGRGRGRAQQFQALGQKV